MILTDWFVLVRSVLVNDQQQHEYADPTRDNDADLYDEDPNFNRPMAKNHRAQKKMEEILGKKKKALEKLKKDREESRREALGSQVRKLSEEMAANQAAAYAKRGGPDYQSFLTPSAPPAPVSYGFGVPMAPPYPDAAPDDVDLTRSREPSVAEPESWIPPTNPAENLQTYVPFSNYVPFANK
jgi:hypothetical protein